MSAPFGAYQAEIYLQALDGTLPDFTTNAGELEESGAGRDAAGFHHQRG